MIDYSHKSILELRPQLNDKLVSRLDGKGWCDKADVQRSAKRHEHVDCLPVVQANNGIHAFGELGANWEGEKRRQQQRRLEVVSEIFYCSFHIICFKRS